MLQLQDRALKRLVTFIQSIQLRLRSGLQTAKHGKRTIIEDRSRVFVNGQATDNEIRQYTSLEAFNRLNSWETGQISLVTRHSLSVPYFKPTYPNTTGNSPVVSKPATLRNTQPLSHEPDGRRKSPQTRPLSPLSSPISAQEHLNSKRNKVPQPSRSFSTALQLIEFMGFSRAHRRLFLLIDGNRSIDELARLMGRTPEDVSELLRNLEDANLF